MTTDINESRFQVRSPDGTLLAVWVQGDGPPLVMVHGSMCDHSRFDPLLPELTNDFTIFAVDRRGFGASGDAPNYALEREFEDVAAVVDAVAARSDAPVALWGHSYGANCALGAAVLTDAVHRLLLYEPSFGLTYPPGTITAVEESLAQGDRETAIVRIFTGILEMTEAEVETFRASPLWPVRLASAPTVPRECRAEERWVWQPDQFGGIKASTLMLSGSESPLKLREITDRIAGMIADVRIELLEGHAHFAFQDQPKMVAAIIREFVRQ
jgi:pimeloyl-ACP methyl ester carboxylesterase